MCTFIDLKAPFSNEEIDRDQLGLPPAKLEDAEYYNSTININAIAAYNRSTVEGFTTVEFLSGQRWLFKIDYEELKSKIANA